MDLLKIPYDRQEFENLWREATYRKPVQGCKELRHGRMKPYPTKTNGKSYLDWYEGKFVFSKFMVFFYYVHQ